MTITLYRPSNEEQTTAEDISALEQMLADGRASLNDYCFYPGASGWMLLRELQIVDGRFVPLPPLPPSLGESARNISTSGRHTHTFEVGLTVQTRHNVLAYVAFALGCLSFLFSAIAAIPGVICAQMAIKQCDADPSLLGRSWAKAGLLLSWIIIIANVLVVLAVALFFTIRR